MTTVDRDLIRTRFESSFKPKFDRTRVPEDGYILDLVPTVISEEVLRLPYLSPNNSIDETSAESLQTQYSEPVNSEISPIARFFENGDATKSRISGRANPNEIEEKVKEKVSEKQIMGERRVQEITNSTEERGVSEIKKIEEEQGVEKKKDLMDKIVGEFKNLVINGAKITSKNLLIFSFKARVMGQIRDYLKKEGIYELTFVSEIFNFLKQKLEESEEKAKVKDKELRIVSESTRLAKLEARQKYESELIRKSEIKTREKQRIAEEQKRRKEIKIQKKIVDFLLEQEKDDEVFVLEEIQQKLLDSDLYSKALETKIYKEFMEKIKKRKELEARLKLERTMDRLNKEWKEKFNLELEKLVKDKAVKKEVVPLLTYEPDLTTYNAYAGLENTSSTLVEENNSEGVYKILEELEIAARREKAKEKVNQENLQKKYAAGFNLENKYDSSLDFNGNKITNYEDELHFPLPKYGKPLDPAIMRKRRIYFKE